MEELACIVHLITVQARDGSGVAVAANKLFSCSACQVYRWDGKAQLCATGNYLVGILCGGLEEAQRIRSGLEAITDLSPEDWTIDPHIAGTERRTLYQQRRAHC